MTAYDTTVAELRRARDYWLAQAMASGISDSRMAKCLATASLLANALEPYRITPEEVAV
jgi:hypothetical protein